MFYLDLFRKLQQRHVRYLVAGGLAMNLHGVPRMTMDVDLVLALDHENLSVFIAAASDLNLQPVLPVRVSDLLDPVIRKQWARERNMIAFGLHSDTPYDPVVDILIDPPINIEEALARAICFEVEGCRVSVASVDDMIRLKQVAGRAQDQADLEHLLRLKGERT